MATVLFRNSRSLTRLHLHTRSQIARATFTICTKSLGEGWTNHSRVEELSYNRFSNARNLYQRCVVSFLSVDFRDADCNSRHHPQSQYHGQLRCASSQNEKKNAPQNM